MNIVAKKNWTYCVYKNEDKYIISIPFGTGAVDFSRAFMIDLKSLDDDYLTERAEEISEKYDDFKKFEVNHP